MHMTIVTVMPLAKVMVTTMMMIVVVLGGTTTSVGVGVRRVRDGVPEGDVEADDESDIDGDSE